MPYVAPTVALCTERGSLSCLPCAARFDVVDARPVYADNGAFWGETCDACHEPIGAGRIYMPVRVGYEERT